MLLQLVTALLVLNVLVFLVNVLLLKGAGRIFGGRLSFGRAVGILLIHLAFFAFCIFVFSILGHGIQVLLFGRLLPQGTIYATTVYAIMVGVVISYILLFFLLKWLAAFTSGQALKTALVYALIYTVLCNGGAFPLRRWGVEAFKIPSSGMSPTIKQGDQIFIKKYDRNLQRGDIAVFKMEQSGDFPGVFRISRAVGLPGEEIEIHDGGVWINGQKLEESSYFKGPVETGGSISIQLNGDQYFFLSDNRDNSVDSRVYGPVSVQQVKGKYWFTYWPASY